MNNLFSKNDRLLNYLNLGNVLIIDGGLSNELESQGFDLNNSLWSAQLLLSQPSAIVDAHLSYLNAGAQCLITASYQAATSSLIAAGLNEQGARELILSSVNLAHQAIDEFLLKNRNAQRPFVAASVGPYGASLADGSEYHGNYGVSDEILRDHHKAQISILAKSNADLLACETVPSLQEALVLKSLLVQESKPAWLSFSCKNGQQLNDGTPIEECLSAFTHSTNPIALGVNCTNPKYIVELIARLKSTCPDKHIVIYPNSGEDFDPVMKAWSGTASPNECAHASIDWIKAGANIVGGCCRMGPQHISSIKKAVGSMKVK